MAPFFCIGPTTCLLLNAIVIIFGVLIGVDSWEEKKPDLSQRGEELVKRWAAVWDSCLAEGNSILFEGFLLSSFTCQ